MEMNKKTQNYFRGCLMGGALGDALGWPIEFMDFGSIQKKYGELGIQDLVLRNGVAEITRAAYDTLSHISRKSGANRVSDLFEQAIKYAISDKPDEICITNLGEGWTGDEALAISIFCALRYQNNILAGIRAAVNHDGDSDSTGSITGNILGAYHGIDQIPDGWIERIELKELILEIADDLLTGFEDTEEWKIKYPER